MAKNLEIADFISKYMGMRRKQNEYFAQRKLEGTRFASKEAKALLKESKALELELDKYAEQLAQRLELLEDKAIEILAKYGGKTSISEAKKHIDNPNAVLKLRYCLEAIIKALEYQFRLEDNINR